MFFGLDTIIRIVYPLLQSLKYLKRKDSDGINAVLKYWCLNWILSFVENFFPLVFNEYISFFVVIALQVFLMYDKFRGSIILFNILVSPLMEKYNGQLQEFFDFIENKLKLKTQQGVELSKQHLKQKLIPKMKKEAAAVIVEGIVNQKND